MQIRGDTGVPASQGAVTWPIGEPAQALHNMSNYTQKKHLLFSEQPAVLALGRVLPANNSERWGLISLEAVGRPTATSGLIRADCVEKIGAD